MAEVSVVVPAYNEFEGIGETIRRIRAAFTGSPHTCEILVVDDGSTDETSHRACEAGASVVHHPYNIGYGNALLTGIREARHELVAITDADGTYPVEELPRMVSEVLDRNLDMLVGARQGTHFKGSLTKRLGRFFFRVWAEFTCGCRIPDINSGLRVMRREMVMEYARVLCGGFSFTTTITIIAMLSHRFVGYRPIAYHKRIGQSHVRYFHDTLRTSQILVMTILLFNPLKLYLPFVLLVLFMGLLAALLVLLVPGLQGPILIGSVFLLTAANLMGFAFLTEQRRSLSQLIAGGTDRTHHPPYAGPRRRSGLSGTGFGGRPDEPIS